MALRLLLLLGISSFCFYLSTSVETSFFPLHQFQVKSNPLENERPIILV